MKPKHTKTLKAVFTKPTLASIAFADIESLLIAVGAKLKEGDGSRVKFTLQSQEWHTHRPHPGKEALKDTRLNKCEIY